MPEQLKRQIGYQRPVAKKSYLSKVYPAKDTPPTESVTKAVAETSPEWAEVVAPAKKLPVKAEKAGKKPDLTGSVIKWISTHPHFKWTKLCFEVGMDPGNFQRVMKTKNPVIKPEILKKIVKILANYGFQVG